MTEICAFSLLAAHMAFKAMVPAAHHNDFRFVHPIVVPVACAVVLCARALAHRSERAGAAARGVIWSFVALSVLYFLPLGPLLALRGS